MLRKVHKPMGLNLRDSDINRPPEYASDLRNVEKNSKGEIVQRWGVDLLTVTWTDKAGTSIGAKTIIDLWEYVGLGGDNRELLALVADGLYRLEGTVFKEIPNCSLQTPNWTVGTSPVEYNKVLYWNDADSTKDFDGLIHLWKYDGGRICRAGSPEPLISFNGGTGGGKFFRAILETLDGQGNSTWSAFVQFENLNDFGTWDLTSIADSAYLGFTQKYGEVGVTKTVQNGDETVATAGNHNFVAGDMVLAFRKKGATGSVELAYIEVSSVAPNATVSFVSPPAGETWVFIAGTPIDKTYRLRIFRSDDEFFNYLDIGTFVVSPSNSDTSPIVTISLGTPLATATPLTAIYDDSYLRALPPKALYWTTFGNHLVCGRQNSGYNTDGVLISPLATAADNTTITDNIVWSDFPTSSNGATVETFNPDYVYAVGTSEDGPISAIHGNDDSLAVHKEEQSYYVYGDFISNTLRVRKAQTSSIGAAAHRSIEEVDGGHFYIAERGAYLSVGGQLPKELSDIIEPLFRDNGVGNLNYDLKNANSINDFYREKVYIFLPYASAVGGDILVFDYYYKEWFLHDNIDASGGFVSINGAIYISDGTNLYQRNLASTKDAGAKIKAYYASGWFDLGEPLLRKKWAKLHLLSIGTSEWTPTVRTQCDWIDTDLSDTEVTPITETIKVIDTDLPLIQSLSVRVIIENFKKNQSLLITGYEVEFEVTQTKPKGQS